MYLAPLNYDRFFKKVFSDTSISKTFLEDFLDIEIETIELLPNKHKLTDDATVVEFDFRCKVAGKYIVIDMQQWYKQDVVQRFYTYHTANTVLQLEDMPNKKKSGITDREIKNYRQLLPVITLIWMVHDTLGFKEDYVSYTMLPFAFRDFVEDQAAWEAADLKKLDRQRKQLQTLLANETKDLQFLQKNRLIFAFQRNIVNNKRLAKYVRWFEFAEKTRKGDNEKGDFVGFKKDDSFKEMMRKLSKEELKEMDYDYMHYQELFLLKAKEIREEGEKKAKKIREEERATTKHYIAKNLLKSGLSVEMVAQNLELPIETVEVIAQKLNLK